MEESGRCDRLCRGEETDDTKKGRWEMRGEEMKCVEERWHEEDRLYWGKEIE